MTILAVNLPIVYLLYEIFCQIHLDKSIATGNNYLNVMSTTQSLTTDATEPAKEFLLNHPRMLGILFFVMYLMTHAGPVAAGGSGAQVGP